MTAVSAEPIPIVAGVAAPAVTKLSYWRSHGNLKHRRGCDK